MVCGKYFGRLVTTLEAICTDATRAGETLREHGVATSHLYVGLETPDRRPNLPQRDNGVTARFIEPTQDTLEFCRAVAIGLRRIWRDGYAYELVPRIGQVAKVGSTERKDGPDDGQEEAIFG